MRENSVERADRLGFQQEKQRDERREGISMKHGIVCRYSGFLEDRRNQRQLTVRMGRYMGHQNNK